jgi:hypothetical protein
METHVWEIYIFSFVIRDHVHCRPGTFGKNAEHEMNIDGGPPILVERMRG